MLCWRVGEDSSGIMTGLTRPKPAHHYVIRKRRECPRRGGDAG